MSGRNRGPPLPMKGAPHTGMPPPVHEPPFGRGLGPMPPHPALLEEMRESQFGMGPRALHPHPMIMEERLAAQHQDIQGLLADNQSLYGLEVDLRGVEAMRNELLKVQADIKELTAVRQELTSQIQVMSQDLARFTADLQQVPALKAEIENVKQELQRARAAIEYEKKGYAENYEHGQVMEKKLISMARELEKLRAEIANAEKRARAAAAVSNPGASFNANYGTPEAGYTGNPYPASYGMNPVQGGAENYPHYGPGPGSWGAYDMQRAQGHR
ncbi:Protein FLX-like 1 [Melia azedarach]|uniref:Protein FLX-like 1 n=1 Tax=Melia azedarach TaxID=155640 RepID=A0ACC1YU01_MELAZ|nr:Protein FLX-like 1 [Melia azedarach]